MENVEFKAFRTSRDENYLSIGKYRVAGGGFFYDAPEKSSTTFIALY